MLTKIARFEFRYLLRNPLLWVTAVLTFVLFVVAMSVEGFELGSEGGLLENAAYATLRNYLMVSIFFMFVTASFVANAVIRDDETGFGPIVRSTSITRFEYVIGRFLGAFTLSALCLLLVPLGMLLGTIMPWADPAQLGPNRLVDHLYAYFLLALPNLFIHSAIFFALATITRSMMATYLGVIGFASGFFLLQGSFAARPQIQKIAAMADAFGARALHDATRYWTVAERNVMLPELSGALLYNRLLWVGIATVCLAIAFAAWRPADQGMSKRARKKQKLVQRAAAEAPVTTSLEPLPSPHHGSAARRALLLMRTRFEIMQVVRSPAFIILLAWGLFTTFFVLITQRDPDGRPTYPTTMSMIPEIEEAFFVIPLIVAIYYAGELVWRERDRRMHEIIDAAPIPDWVYVVSRTAAMGFVLLALLLVNVLASITVQLSLEYTQLEIGKYLLWYVLPLTWDMLLLAALAVFVQALSPHKAVGWGIMVVFVMWTQINTTVDHNLLLFGGTPWMPLSDMNGAGSFWQGPWTFRLYWGAFAVLLLLAAHLLWRRGTEVRLRPRLARARRHLTGAPGWIAAGAVVVFTATGACAYYNTNVLNQYRTGDAADRWAVALEKRYWKYYDLPQPVVVHLALNVELHPEERRAVTRGRYLLRNLTSQPISDIHVRLLDEDLELTSAEVTGAQLIVHDPEFKYRIYRLDEPMEAGDERLMTFETRRWHRGFRNMHPNTRLVENGTFLDRNELAPAIGMSHHGMLWHPAKRRRFGLPEQIVRASLEDPGATSKPSLGQAWAMTDITVSTSADQTPIAPGSKISDVRTDGRRIARFVSKAPVRPVFSIQSARYAEKHRRHAEVDLSVYYHAGHEWNVDRMLDALAVSLDYYQANFGPYQFDHVRIVEFPGYASYAKAFAGTIPYSETYGFIANVQRPETVDFVTGTTAHELAHQYWAHQVTGADMEGQAVLTETLAQYSAMMVIKRMHGEDQIRRHLQYELDRYLEGRAWAPADERPLARADGQNWIVYHKGSLAMYLLQKRMGEDAVNRALRSLLDEYRFKGAPYPRSIDFVELLRAEAKTAEEQNLITDLFERITLYDMKVVEPSAVQRADGRWDVTVPIEAKKLYRDGDGGESDTPLDERIEVGLFTAEPGRDHFDASKVVLMERHPIRTGQQVLKFVTDRRPTHAGVDPYNFYIDRNAADNVAAVR
jgi:ABC-2 type transport system permease protein